MPLTSHEQAEIKMERDALAKECVMLREENDALGCLVKELEESLHASKGAIESRSALDLKSSPRRALVNVKGLGGRHVRPGEHLAADECTPDGEGQSWEHAL